MDDIRIRFAEPGDAAQIADLFCASFRPDFARLLIYGCKGASEFIRVQLMTDIKLAESAYFVAQAPMGIIGAVELRRQENRLLLNYIAVHSSYRGRSIGEKLLLNAVTLSGVSSGRIQLDVLHNNDRALEWYRRLGFVIKTSSEFLELGPPLCSNGGSAYVSGLPQADLCQKQFGFSQFNLTTRDRTISVGRVGDMWFRLTDLTAAGDPLIFAALKVLDPERRIFAIVPAFPAPPAQVVERLAKTHRMEAEIPGLVSSLPDDIQNRL